VTREDKETKMQEYEDFSARSGRILFGAIGILLIVVGIVLLFFPTPAMQNGPIICGVIGVALLIFSFLAPKRLMFWLSEILSLLWW
jgi:uncharacterized membrane protein HdeD (DUF308 family)